MVMIMNNQEINNLKIKINELENEIIDKQEIKRKYNAKTEKLRRFAILNTILAATSHFLAFFIHPSLLVVALLLLLTGVVPEGFVLFHREDKELKFDKEIEKNNEEIKKIKEMLEIKLNESKEYIEPLKNLIDEIKINEDESFKNDKKESKKIKIKNNKRK